MGLESDECLEPMVHCPPVKYKKLEVCPLCHVSPCQCGQARPNPPKKMKKSKKRSICKKSGKRVKPCRSVPMCFESHQNYLIHKNCSYVSYQNDYYDLCTQELINFCWLLLTPDTLNRLKMLLHENHGYSFQEAEEYIERKQTNVLNDLRLMAVSGKVTPLGCNVINLLMKRKTECSNPLETQIHEIFKCFPVQENNNLNLNQLLGFKVQSIFQKLIRDIQQESKRQMKCSTRYERNNSNHTVEEEPFIPWEMSETQESGRNKVTFCEPISPCIPDFSTEMSHFDNCIRCLKTLMTKNCYTDATEVKTAQSVDNNDNTEDKNATTTLQPPCRTIIRSNSKSNLAIITSCCEPQLKVVKDQSTNITSSIMKVGINQTTPEPKKLVRSQSVQTEIKGKHTSVQTELVSDHAIDSDILSIINTSIEDFFKKKESRKILDTKPDKPDESVTFLHDLINNEIVSSSETLQAQPTFLHDLINNEIASSSETLQAQPRTITKCIHTGPGEEDSFLSTSSQLYFSQSSLNNTDTTYTEAVENMEFFETKCAPDTPQTSASSYKNGQSPEVKLSSRDFSINKNLDKNEPILLRKEKTEDPRVSIFINKRPSSGFDEADDLSYHTPELEQSPSEHVKFNLDFNEEELRSRIFEHDYDDEMKFFTQSETSSSSSQYNDALDTSRDDFGLIDELFQVRQTNTFIIRHDVTKDITHREMNDH